MSDPIDIFGIVPVETETTVSCELADWWITLSARMVSRGFRAFSGIVPGKAGNGSAGGFVNCAIGFMTIRFSLNVCKFLSLNSLKICHSVKGLEPLPLSHLLFKRPGCYHSTSTRHVRDRIIKLSPIHASVIIIFHTFAEFSESYAPFRKNPNRVFLKCTRMAIMPVSSSESLLREIKNSSDKILPPPMSIEPLAQDSKSSMLPLL